MQGMNRGPKREILPPSDYPRLSALNTLIKLGSICVSSVKRLVQVKHWAATNNIYLIYVFLLPVGLSCKFTAGLTKHKINELYRSTFPGNYAFVVRNGHVRKGKPISGRFFTYCQHYQWDFVKIYLKYISAINFRNTEKSMSFVENLKLRGPSISFNCI